MLQISPMERREWLKRMKYSGRVFYTLSNVTLEVTWTNVMMVQDFPVASTVQRTRSAVG